MRTSRLSTAFLALALVSLTAGSAYSASNTRHDVYCNMSGGKIRLTTDGKLRFYFRHSASGAGKTGNDLKPGECAYSSRAFRSGEPSELYWANAADGYITYDVASGQVTSVHEAHGIFAATSSQARIKFRAYQASGKLLIANPSFDIIKL